MFKQPKLQLRWLDAKKLLYQNDTRCFYKCGATEQEMQLLLSMKQIAVLNKETDHYECFCVLFHNDSEIVFESVCIDRDQKYWLYICEEKLSLFEMRAMAEPYLKKAKTFMIEDDYLNGATMP